MDLIDRLREDHRRILAQIEELERNSAAFTDPPRPAAQDKLRELLQRIIEMLSSHCELESAELFPALRSRPETDDWQVGMMEVQEEMILNEARQLCRLVSEESAAVPVARLRQSVAHLIRWLREHVMIEEDHLFPRFQAPPEA